MKPTEHNEREGRVMVTTVPGTKHGTGSRTVVFVHDRADGSRRVDTLDVSGNRERVRAALEVETEETNIIFDKHYDKE